jgi:hypothetical protein
MTFQELSTAWMKWQADHPKLAGLVVAIESTAVGTAVDLITNGVDFSNQGLKHAATIIGTAVVMAVRNYLKSNAADLKTKLGTTNPNNTGQ